MSGFGGRGERSRGGRGECGTRGPRGGECPRGEGPTEGPECGTMMGQEECPRRRGGRGGRRHRNRSSSSERGGRCGGRREEPRGPRCPTGGEPRAEGSWERMRNSGPTCPGTQGTEPRPPRTEEPQTGRTETGSSTPMPTN